MEFFNETFNFNQLNLFKYYLLILALLFTEASDYCRISTCSGTTYIGVTNETIIEPKVNFCSYLGIQYGQVGRRFERPVLAKPSKGVYYATSDGPQCAQADSNGSLVGIEDCLYLNVFTPKIARKFHQRLFPVIVFVYGGGYSVKSSTSTQYLPSFLIMEQDLVVVAMNYRLNVFGFLNLRMPECGGNMGLRDQSLALEWVRKNIESFGGDPNRVTMMGESSGAASVYLHALSPLSRDHFGRAIIESPIAVSYTTNTAGPYSLKFAKYSGYKGCLRDSYRILHYLRQFNTSQLIKLYSDFIDYLTVTDISLNVSKPYLPFYPTVDGAYLGKSAFLPCRLEKLGKQAPNIPIIIGQLNADATVYFGAPATQNDSIAFVRKHLALFLDPIFTRNQRTKEEVVTKIEQYYYNQSNPGNILSKTIDLLTDLKYYNFYRQIAVFHKAYCSGNIFVYQFCYDNDTNLQHFKEGFANVPGTAHGDKLTYQFYASAFYPNIHLTTNDKKLIHEFTTTWLRNFVKFGNPNRRHDRVKLEWKPSTPEKNSFMLINTTSLLFKTRIDEKSRVS